MFIKKKLANNFNNKMNLINNDNTKNTISKLQQICSNQNEISKNVQWLISLGGTIEIIEQISLYFCKKKQKIIINVDKSIEILKLKSTMIFISSTTDSGHWIYVNNYGIVMNSYTLDHQQQDSAQFCQTYAILYMLGDNNTFMKKKFTDKLKSGKNHYSDNIKIVVKFWRYMFRYDNELSNWLISEVKSINNYDIINNYSCITYNTIEINKNLIKKLLCYIYNKSDEIALLC
jgi:hypothetical protein